MDPGSQRTMKIPLNPPFSKGETRYPPLEKGGRGGFERSFSSDVTMNLSRDNRLPFTKMRWFRKMKDDAVPSVIIAMADIKSTLGPDSSTEERKNFHRWSTETIK